MTPLPKTIVATVCLLFLSASYLAYSLYGASHGTVVVLIEDTSSPADGTLAIELVLDATPQMPELALASPSQPESEVTEEPNSTVQQADHQLNTLLTTEDVALQKAAFEALSQSSDDAVLQLLTQTYANVPEHYRGRILDVLQSSLHPSAQNALAQLTAS